MFTIGGLFGSLGANRVMDTYGRKGAVQISAAFVVLGGVFMTVASTMHALILGRYVTCLFTMSLIDLFILVY